MRRSDQRRLVGIVGDADGVIGEIGRHGLPDMQAHRNATVAIAPSTVRTAWSPPHLTISARDGGPALSISVPIKASLVGLMPKIVHGHGAIMAIAPIRKPGCDARHHANSPRTKPISASGACMANPRREAGFQSASS